MKVFALYPGFQPNVNEMTAVWEQVCLDGDIECMVISARTDCFKGARATTSHLDIGSLRIRWIAADNPIPISPELLELADNFAPDIVFAATRMYLPVATVLARRLNAKVVVHTEFFATDAMLVNRREYFGVPWIRPFAAERARARMIDCADLILYSDPREQARNAGDPMLAYLPWPHVRPACRRKPALVDRSRLIYIGSFSRMKGAGRLFEYFNAALRRLPDLGVLLVGPTIDGQGKRELRKFRERWTSRVEYLDHVPRDEAMSLIESAFMILSPGESLGWGQIGDAWWRGTPVVAVREHYELRADMNCIVTTDAERFADAVATLRNNPSFAGGLTAGGKVSVAAHAEGVVASTLRAALTRLDSRFEVRELLVSS